MLKTLLAQIKEYKKDTILTPVLVVVEVILEVVIPLLMAMIIDKGIEVRDMNMVVKLGIITLLASFISLAAGGLAGKYAAKASTGFAKNLRKAMYYNIQDFSFANIDKYSTALKSQLQQLTLHHLVILLPAEISIRYYASTLKAALLVF